MKSSAFDHAEDMLMYISGRVTNDFVTICDRDLGVHITGSRSSLFNHSIGGHSSAIKIGLGIFALERRYLQ